MPNQADYQALLAALTGSATLGQYPDTLVDRLDAALEAAWDVSTGMDLSIPDLTGPSAGPFAGADTYQHAVEDQVLARYPGPPNKPRTLVEKAKTLEALVAGIKGKLDAGTPPPSGGGSTTLPAGTSQGSLEWAADLSKSGVVAAGYKSTDWNTQAGPAWPPPIGDYAGRRAIKFQLGGGGKRIEVEPNHRTFGSSGNAWFGFQFYLESDFPLSASSWHVIWQLHGNDTTSPKMALQAHKGGMTVGDNGAFTPLVKQKWYQCVVYPDFSAGRMSVWLDDVKVIDNYNTGKSNPDYYLKVGSYQDPGVGAGTIYQAAHKLGSGYGAVAGKA